jgi:hypothetical protein
MLHTKKNNANIIISNITLDKIEQQIAKHIALLSVNAQCFIFKLQNGCSSTISKSRMFSKTLVSTFTMAWALLLLLGVLVQERFQPILHVSAFQGMNKIGPRTTPFAFTGTIQKSVVQHLSSSTSLFSEVTSAPNKSVVDASDSTSTSSQRTTTGSHTPFTNPKSNQPKYGKELDLPHTYVRCGRCFTNYALTEEDLGTGKGR